MILAAGCASQRSTQPETTPSAEEYYSSGDERDEPDRPPAAGEVPGPGPTAPPALVRRAPTCSGGRDCDAAGRAIFERSEQLQACYEAAGADAVGRGVVYVLLDVQPEGAVEGVLVGYSDVRSTSFMRCLDEQLGALEMPASAAASVVQALLVFGARDRAEGRSMLAAYRAARAVSEQERVVPLTAIRQSVQSCHERTFRGRETQAGRLVLNVTVQEDGRVASVEITEDAFDGRLDECVIDTVEKLTLDVEEGMGTTFVYPVVLQPGAQSGPAPTDAQPR
jgi:hypothetical protein